VDLFIVPSSYVENILLSAGIKKEKVVVLPHFIPEAKNKSTAVEGVTLPHRYLLSFGAISKEKGIETLLRISKVLDIPLLLAGRWESGPDLKRYQKTRYIGMRTKAELDTLIAHATAVVSASELPETFGLTALETIALGKPYFAFDTGALHEIVRNGFNGFLAQNEKILEETLRAYILGTRMYASKDDICQDALARFGQEAYMRRFEESIAKIVKM
jgi:glycosyltransferase involved in cell wall biosynthesis